MILNGATVLVTGGSGAFGQAFIRRILRDNHPQSVRVFSSGESRQADMRMRFNDDRLRYLIGNVRDQDRVSDALRGVDIVIHAAAMKRIEQCEADPWEAYATNVGGTQHVARACIERGVEKAVFLSTDKAAAPNTLYGATKLTAERLWIQSNVYAAGTDTRFSATRYGNVIASTGSVVPTWRQQALMKGRITVTDVDMSRFFMRIEEAVDLVLFALEQMRGGEVFIPKIRAASIGRLADAVAPSVPRDIVGARAGEKMHETLISEDEACQVRDLGQAYALDPLFPMWSDEAVHGVPVPLGFTYRSDTAEQFSVEELQELVR
jgi:UDP-N-acetylglucosamine 4,6-dehydratase